MNRDLMQTLEVMGERANQLTRGTLNMGGCCVYASLLGRKLQEKGIYVRGVGAGDVFSSNLNVQRLRRNVSRANRLSDWEEGCDLHHFGLRFGTGQRAKLYDSAGFYSPTSRWLHGEEIIPGTFSIPELEALASNPHNWNDHFDRAHYIPKLKQLIDNMLEET